MNDYKSLFSKSLSSAPERLHFAAHSHHLWPDATGTAHEQCWQDAVTLADMKWDKVFGTLVPALQKELAKHLSLPDPATIAFAPNTHEFVLRLLSCLEQGGVPHILTTDSEFHSFNRQVTRLEEDGLLKVTRIATEPFGSFPARFTDAAKKETHDMVFFSHVFFNSGYAVPDLKALVKAVPDRNTLIVVDGYHGFMALPTDISAIADRAFYMAGGYKYAMSGEGCCFMHCPKGYTPRPRNTGWFASFGTLSQKQDKIAYNKDGSRFMGATFDPAGLYRMKAVMDMLAAQNIDVPIIHDHILQLQDDFLKAANTEALGTLITPVNTKQRGHFLTFETEKAHGIHTGLLEHNVITDVRGNRLRFGFGLYHDIADIKALADKLAKTTL